MGSMPIDGPSYLTVCFRHVHWRFMSSSIYFPLMLRSTGGSVKRRSITTAVIAAMTLAVAVAMNAVPATAATAR
jgi:hypothetical protein